MPGCMKISMLLLSVNETLEFTLVVVVNLFFINFYMFPGKPYQRQGKSSDSIYLQCLL